MAIAYDNALQTQVNSSVTSVTRSLNITGSDTALVTNALSTTSADMTGVTYNSVSLTKAGELNQDAFSTEIHYLLNTASGVNNVVWTNGSSATFVTTATSYSGVSTSFTPTVGSTTGSSNSMSHSITVATNSIIVSCSRTAGSQPFASGTNYTRRASNATNGVHIGSSGTLSSGSNTVTVSLSATEAWGFFLLELEEAGGSPPATFTPKVMWFS